MRWKPPRARATRTRGEILPQLTMACQDPKTRNHKIFTVFLDSQNLHNSFTKSPQMGRNFTTPNTACQVFFTDSQNLHIFFTIPTIEHMFGPHRSSCAAIIRAFATEMGLYGAHDQNQPIRAHSTELVYTGPAGRTSPSGRPIPGPLAARTTLRSAYTGSSARTGLQTLERKILDIF